MGSSKTLDLEKSFPCPPGTSRSHKMQHQLSDDDLTHRSAGQMARGSTFCLGWSGGQQFQTLHSLLRLETVGNKMFTVGKKRTTNISAPVTITASFFLFYFSSHHSAKVMLGHFRMKRCTFCYYLAQSVKSSSAISSSRV